MNVVTESEALHERVRAFGRGDSNEAFETLALALARFQARHSPGFARLVEARGSMLTSLEDVPGVPTRAFRLARVGVHAPELDVARFVTSGTTAEERGTHVFRTTRTYEELALRFGARAFGISAASRRVVICLAPVPDEPPASSLAFMLDRFARAWDGRALDGGDYRPGDPARWLVRERAIDVDGLTRALAVARERGEPLLVLATAFALVALLDALGRRTLEAPADSVVMVTGGFKGRTREVPQDELATGVTHAFGLSLAQLVGEYGMTELSSQLYEGTVPGSSLGGEHGVFVEPAWLRVTPVDPVSLEPVPSGTSGIARIVDLANVDSAVVVQTEDLVRRRGAGIELLGRLPGAPARGCSLAVEALLA